MQKNTVHLKDNIYVTTDLRDIPGQTIKIDGILEFIAETEANWFVDGKSDREFVNYSYSPTAPVASVRSFKYLPKAQASLISAVESLGPRKSGKSIIKTRVRIVERKS